jgi:hypothetical protein
VGGRLCRGWRGGLPWWEVSGACADCEPPLNLDVATLCERACVLGLGLFI